MAATARALTVARKNPTGGAIDVKRVAMAFVAMAGSLLLLGIFVPIGIALLIAVPILAIWMWSAPFRVVYLMVGIAAMIEVFPLNFPDSLTDRVPIFLNLNSTAGLQGFSFSPAEILILTGAVVAIARGAQEHSLEWPSGRLPVAYGLYLAVVLAAEVHGLLSGGDWKTSLWELRPQLYGFVLFVMTTVLLKDRSQLLTLAIVFLASVMAKAVIGDFRYFVTLQRTLSSSLDVLAHDDSYFLSVFVTAALVAAIWIKNRRLTVALSMSSAVALAALLANSRRAGVYAVAGGVFIVLLLAFRFEPDLRRRIGWSCVLLALVYTGLLVDGWDKQYGLEAQLVRPVRSLIDPSSRDFSSDQYRVAETANLQFTYRTSPLFGIGFGHPFYIVTPMANISQFYSLWNVIPHNTLMWVPMRMGLIGMVAFWGWIGIALLEGFGVIRTNKDPLVRAVAAFAIAAVVAELAVAYGDIQLESYRNMIFLGVLLGVLTRLPQMAQRSSAVERTTA